MLARNAESLYWIGRYVERADDTSRILDVSVHQLLEDATVDADAAGRQLLSVLGIAPPAGTSLDVRPLTDLVAFSREHPGSIVSSISSARENARGAREVISAELWECINAMWNAVAERQRAAKRFGPHAFFSFVEERAAMFAGFADSTMSRDDGWRFLVLGRSVERVDMIVRLLLSRVGGQVVVAWLGDRVALGGCARHVSADLPGCVGCRSGGAVSVAGQAVPAFGVPCVAAGGVVFGAA
jgi:uncharacterized alpha-E superfamily protein